MSTEIKENNPKKPYQKPQITQVELRPDEAVLGACKNATSSGPSNAACTTLSCTEITS